ncbi:REDY-like protein HapK [Glacieibacterium frigidum]|uniref:REDY-like protein HapK n=1 Tax=Glacieibacterium frigidum TaxID=2593303 RepID=A0A552UFG1_9SPHN|nr:REDY-like protein HapK [Glacieibacterium frigidum]TRW16958.1 REDY-like protein HapK [Glacieibacterium frigidum]
MRVIVLFNLKPGKTAADYEDWARTRDIPGVRSMPSVDDFTVLRTTGLLGSDTPAPYGYVEIIEIADMQGFWTDIATEAAQAVAAEFREWAADEPVFMTTEELGLG